MYLTHEIRVKTSKGMQRLQTLHINIHKGYSNYTITGSPVTLKINFRVEITIFTQCDKFSTTNNAM